MSATNVGKVADLADLVDVMRQAEGFAEVCAALSRGESAAIDGAWGSSCALAAAALARDAAERAENGSAGVGEPVLLVILPRISEVDDFAVDLAGFLGR